MAHHSLSKKEKHDIVETYFYRLGILEFVSVLDEIKFKDGSVIRKSGLYLFDGEKLISKKEENGFQVNPGELVTTSRTLAL